MSINRKRAQMTCRKCGKRTTYRRCGLCQTCMEQARDEAREQPAQETVKEVPAFGGEVNQHTAQTRRLWQNISIEFCQARAAEGYEMTQVKPAYNCYTFYRAQTGGAQRDNS